MNTIEEFVVFEGLGNYDRENNPRGLTVQQLLPIGVSWLCGGMRHKVEHGDGLIATNLRTLNGIALVFSPFNKALNNAVILKPDGTAMWDVRHIAFKIAPGCIFTDVYYVDGELFFFIYFNGQDYRFSFDVNKGAVGELVPSY